LNPVHSAKGATDDRGEFRLVGAFAGKCFVEAGTQSASDSNAVVARRQSLDRTTRYPSGERSVDNTITLSPGQSVAVGDLVANIRDDSSFSVIRTSAFHGRVVDLRSTAPVVPAMVSAEDERSKRVLTAPTDLGGRFSLELPSGTYRVWASAPGYITDRANALMVHSPEGPTSPNDLQQDTTLRLRRGGVIDGFVYSENGEPLEGAIVHLHRDRYVFGEKRPVVEPQRTTTDDRGAYRFFGLQPGSYYVSASFAEYHDDVAIAQTVVPIGEDGIAPTFYPIGSGQGAVAIVIDAESTVDDVSLTWSLSNGGALAVQVLDEDGAVSPNAVVEIGPTLRSRLPLSLGGRATTDERGYASIGALAIGEYLVHVYGKDGRFGSGLGQVSSGSTTLIPVKLGRGVEIRGHVIDATTGRPPSNVASFSIRALPASFGDAPSTAPARPQASGDFLLRSVSGSVWIRLTGPDDYYLKRVVADGVDTTDFPIHLDGPSIPRMLIVEVGRDHTNLSGSVVRASDSARTSRCTVVAFATDANKVGPLSRFVAAIPCESDSSFHYSKLPVGQYFVFATGSIDEGQVDDREWLDAHRNQAETVRLADGTKEAVSLKLVE
jgi:hypothetical protein